MSRAAGSDFQFVDDDIDVIIDELIEQYELVTGRIVQPSSPERLFIAWIADALVEAYARINYAGNQNIPSRAEGENLDALGELFFDEGRPEATPATTTMRFTISAVQANDVIIPAGTRVCPEAGEPVFATIDDSAVIAGNTYADVECQCQTDGTIGNGYAAGKINTLMDISNILYYDHCANIDESSGGTEEATDDEYYELLVSSQAAYSCAGSRGAYEYWAKTVSTGIADVVVNSPSAGVIKIYAIMDDGAPADAATKAAILAACSDESVRPLTDNVIVDDPSPVSYDIELTYYLPSDSTLSTSEMEAAIANAVDEYVSWQSARLGKDINPSMLISMVMAAGAKRVTVSSPEYTALADGRSSAVTPDIATVGNITLTNGGTESD